jgi:hypothetical protein
MRSPPSRPCGYARQLQLAGRVPLDANVIAANHCDHVT